MRSIEELNQQIDPLSALLPPARSPELLAEMEKLTTMILSSQQNVLVTFQHYLFSRGIHARNKTNNIYIPYGESSKTYRRQVLESIVTNIYSPLGLEIVRMAYRYYAIVSKTQIVGLITFQYPNPGSVEVLNIANVTLVEHIYDSVLKLYPEISPPVIERLKIDGRSNTLDTTPESLPPRDRIEKIELLYPWYNKTPAQLWKEFSESTSNVLLLIGPPGTGKSSFILEMLHVRDWDGNVYLADRDDVLGHPGLADFIRGVPRGSVVVTEDSDRLVARREDGNSGMSALLNATAGIISTDTKIIISTNLASVRKVDEALMRPGRCFEVLTFQLLTLDQGYKIREVMNLEEVELESPSGELTLAEVINYTSNAKPTSRKAEVGFIPRS